MWPKTGFISWKLKRILLLHVHIKRLGQCEIEVYTPAEQTYPLEFIVYINMKHTKKFVNTLLSQALDCLFGFNNHKKQAGHVSEMHW